MKHRCKELEKMVADAVSKGFRVKEIKSGRMLYPPDPSWKIMNIHHGERGLHPLRRMLQEYWACH